MVRKNFTPEQIINKLREAEIHINQGISIAADQCLLQGTSGVDTKWLKSVLVA